MKTIVEKIDCNHIDRNLIEKAASILRNGGLVAFPTETVYGLGANGLDVCACKKIYEAKGRPSDNPLILHIAQLNQLNKIVKDIPKIAPKLIEAFWPGPLTLVFPKADCVPKEITGGFDTVAVRFPSNKLARALIEAAGLPIAAPSANSSGKPSPTRASHVEYDLSGKIDMILDGGAADVGLESTILDISADKPILLRPGAITQEMIEKMIGPIDVDPAVMQKPDASFVPKAPGMKYIHYSPKANIVLVRGEIDKVPKIIADLAKKAVESGKKTGIIVTNQTKDQYHIDGVVVLLIGDRQNQEEIGANLFKILRRCDYLNLEQVYAETFEEYGEGMAIMNRLKKAAGYQIIDIS